MTSSIITNQACRKAHVVIMAALTAALFGLLLYSQKAEAQQAGWESGVSALQYTADGLLALQTKPIVIGHEGAGENFGNDTSKPINDTIPSVRLAFEQGASLVEVDVEITSDAQAVAHHDFDFLSDGTCINSLTLDQLQQKVPYIPSLEAVLNQAKQFNRKSGHPSGLLVLELKTPSPLCDPNDTSEMLLVSTVVNTVRRLDMSSAVIFDGFSPALLYLASLLAPEIPRELDLDALQLLPPGQVAAATGLPVTLINKELNLGLQWANLGSVYRLPGYGSLQQFFFTAFAIGARIVGFERDALDFAATQPGGAAALVSLAHSLSLKVYANPAHDAATFAYFGSLGVDGAYCDDVPASLGYQPPL